MKLKPLKGILDLTSQEDGSYCVEFPRSVCFGLVTQGGLLISVAHKAAQLFVVSSLRGCSHLHLLQSSVNFFRPVLASPKNARVIVRLINSSKIWTTFHTDILQDGKLCMVGCLTFTDLCLTGPISASTGWKLSPPPLPASLDSLQADDDLQWVSYLTPVSPKSIRNVQSYMKYYVPIERRDPSFLDQWVTPGWIDSTQSGDAVWTNELIHFVIDNNLPYWQNSVPQDTISYSRYEAIVAAGLEQRRARREGRDDRIFGDGCGPTGPLTWLNSSISISTEIKKLLPENGTKWLFMRCFSSKLENNRLDEQVFVMDMHGDLVAVTHHVSHVIPIASKLTDKTTKL